MSFSRLSSLDPGDRTYWVALPEVSPGAEIEVRFAGESNKPYFNALLRRAAKRNRQGGARQAAVQALMLEEGRSEDRILFPKYVCSGKWQNVLDDDNNEVECSIEALKEFCEQLPAWLFDKIRTGAATPENFLDDEDDLVPADPSVLAKN